jgi:hypothetical protein
VTRIDAFRGGVRVASDLPWVAPSTVTVDETASSWRTCEVTVADMDRSLIPSTPQAALAPYGTDLFIQTGFRYADGTTELLPMGVFRILVARSSPKGRISMLGYDYSRVVARARFEVPRVFARGTGRANAIGSLIDERTSTAGPPGWQVLTYNVADDSTLPLTIFEEGERYGDPWKACTDIADSGGQQVFFLPTGPWPTAILRPAPDLTNAVPVWHFEKGEGSTLVEISSEQDTTTGYNVYVVSGESSELASDDLVPVRASAEVTDADSPIFPATYGRVPIFFASSFIKTAAQCQQVADANLPLKAGGSESITIKAFAHPAHEAGDVVRAVDEYLGISSLWIVSRFSIDLTLRNYADYTCRAKRVA